MWLVVQSKASVVGKGLSVNHVFFFQNEPELYYKFSQVFMQHIPEDTVNAWIEQKRRLDPRKLIPALVYYEQKDDKALVRTMLVFPIIMLNIVLSLQLHWFK